MTKPAPRFLVFLLLSLYAGASRMDAADYHVSPTGRDEDDGSVETPWSTINHAISRAAAGDILHLAAGATFTEDVYFGPGDGGLTGVPVTITSDPDDRATLRPATATNPAISVYNTGHLSFANLILLGPGTGVSQEAGLSCYVDDARYEGLRFVNLDCSGFGRQGLVIGGWEGIDHGYGDVTVEDCRFHHNEAAGFFLFGQFRTSHTNVIVRRCRADHSRSGDGILINGVTGALVEHCVAHDNGALGDARVGIWTYGVDGVTIQYCEAFDNRTAGSFDGGGFDFDGGTVNSVMQYNYSHGNDGDGFALYQYAGALAGYGRLENNVIRYNISENDGRRNGYGGLSFWGDSEVDQVGSNEIHNNTVYMGGTPTDGSPSAVRYIGSNFRGLRLSNNLFIAADGLRLLHADEAMDTTRALHQGNNWWAQPGTPFRIQTAATIYQNIAAWRTTGNERLRGSDIGSAIDPLLTTPGSGTAAGYRLRFDSPLIDAAAVTISSQGTRDYFGNMMPQGANYDIGAHDSRPTVTLTATTPGMSETSPLPGGYTLARTGGTQVALPIAYAFTGTATVAQDYTLPTLPSSIPAGASQISLTVVPVADNLAEGDETVIGILADNGSATPGGGSATIILHDRPFDAWRFGFFGGNPPASDNLADPDHDGLTNLLEYALERSPIVSEPLPPFPSPIGLPLTFTFTRVRPDVTYTVQTSPDLSSWSDLATDPGSFGQPVTVGDDSPAGASQRFIRLKISAP